MNISGGVNKHSQPSVTKSPLIYCINKEDSKLALDYKSRAITLLDYKSTVSGIIVQVL